MAQGYIGLSISQRFSVMGDKTEDCSIEISPELHKSLVIGGTDGIKRCHRFHNREDGVGAFRDLERGSRARESRGESRKDWGFDEPQNPTESL